MIHTADASYEDEMAHLNNNPIEEDFAALKSGSKPAQEPEKSRSTLGGDVKINLGADLSGDRGDVAATTLNPATPPGKGGEHEYWDYLTDSYGKGPVKLGHPDFDVPLDRQFELWKAHQKFMEGAGKDYINEMLMHPEGIRPGTPITPGMPPEEPHMSPLSPAGANVVVGQNITINRDHDIPYIAGASKDNDSTVYVDKELPTSVNISGVNFDPAHPAAMHELAEKPAMEYFTKVKGMSDEEAYELAHHAIANPTENTFYSTHGIDLTEVDKFWKTQDDRDEKEPRGDEPKDLYKKPYSHGDKPDKNFEEVWGPNQLNDKQKAALYDYHIASGAPTPPDPEAQQILDQAKFRNLLRYYMGPKKLAMEDKVLGPPDATPSAGRLLGGGSYPTTQEQLGSAKNFQSVSDQTPKVKEKEADARR